MIRYTISSKTKRWSKRIKKIEQTINQVLAYKKGLKTISKKGFNTLAKLKGLKH